jgi:23S rRNA (uracil1939-C5)-methyltransferase
MRIKIEKLVFGGWGLGRVEGKVVFVPYVMPGEVVEAEIVAERKDYAFAELKELISPAPGRQTPVCPHFGFCGGCDYQHIPYELQLKFKEEQLKEEITHLLGQDIVSMIEPILPSPNAFSYRNRLKLRVKREGYQVRLGAYKKNTKEFIAIDNCPVAEELIRQCLPVLQMVLSQHAAIAEQITGVELFSSKDEGKGFIVFKTLIGINKKRLFSIAEELMSSLSFLKDVLYEHMAFVYPRSLFDKGYTQSGLFYEVEGVRLIRYPGTFFQVNTEQNKNLVRHVKTLVAPSSAERILELYAGIGNLSLPLAKTSKRLVGLETNSLAVKNANYNAQLNKVRAVFKRIDVETALEEFLKEDNAFDCLVLDPPRTGCIRSLKTALGLFQPQKIVYVSCHPATLARDLKFLLGQGYQLKSIQPLDMFPQTQHIETITLLTLNS